MTCFNLLANHVLVVQQLALRIDVGQARAFHELPLGDSMPRRPAAIF